MLRMCDFEEEEEEEEKDEVVEEEVITLYHVSEYNW